MKISKILFSFAIILFIFLIEVSLYINHDNLVTYETDLDCYDLEGHIIDGVTCSGELYSQEYYDLSAISTILLSSVIVSLLCSVWFWMWLDV